MKTKNLLILFCVLATAFVSISIAKYITNPHHILIITLWLVISITCLCFLLYRLIKEKTIEVDWFSPLIIFPLAYLLFYSVGAGITVIWFGGEIPVSQWFYYILGLVFFVIGAMTISLVFKIKYIKKTTGVKEPKKTKSWNLNTITKISYLLFFLGIPFILSLISIRGLPFFEEANIKRFGESAQASGYIFYLALLIQIAAILLIFVGYLRKKFTLFSLLVIGISLILLTLYGSRAQIVPILAAFLLCHHYLMRKLRFKNIVVIGLLLFLLISLFGVLRVMGDISSYKEYLFEKKYPPSLWFLAPATFATRAPIDSFKIILQKIPSEKDYWHGRLLLSPFLTFLPGKQALGQYAVTDEILKGDAMLSGATALSFCVPFYIDFGLLGLVIGMIVSGMLIQFFYCTMFYKRREIDYLIYITILTEYLIWIYGGFLPSTIVFWRVFIFVGIYMFLSLTYLSAFFLHRGKRT